jgi:hypothetical protein
MQRNYNNEDFEQFLKQSADSYRMRPSDKVWKGISNNLSERRRKIGLTTGGFLFLASILGYFFIDTSKNIAVPEASAQIELNSGSSVNAATAPETKMKLLLFLLTKEDQVILFACKIN